MDSIITLIKKTIKDINPLVCWYPGARFDFQIIDTYLNESELLKKASPKLFLFNDKDCYFIDVNGVIRDSNHNTINIEGFELVELFKDENDIERWEISLDQENDCWKEYQTHPTVSRFERGDNPIDQFDVLMEDNSKEKANVLNQIGKFYSTVSLYKKGNIYLLLFNYDSNELVSSFINEQIDVDSLIIYTHSNAVEFRWLEYLDTKEFCFYKRKHEETEIIFPVIINSTENNRHDSSGIILPQAVVAEFKKYSNPFRWYSDRPTDDAQGCIFLKTK